MSYLDEITQLSIQAQEVISRLAVIQAERSEAGEGSPKLRDQILRFTQLLSQSLNTSLSEENRLKLLTRLVNDARLADVPYYPYPPIEVTVSPTQRYVGDHNSLSNIEGDGFFHLSAAQRSRLLSALQPADLTFVGILGLPGDNVALAAVLAGKEPVISPSGNAAQFLNGNKVFAVVQYSQIGGKPTTLAGLGISASDTLFDGKYLQLSSPLTGLSTLIGTQLDSSTTIIQGFGRLQNQVNTKEPALGNPGADGYVLSSTMAGVRSWVPAPTGAEVTSISIVEANGFAGSVVIASGNAEITLSTSVTGMVKGDGNTFGPASEMTDYLGITGASEGDTILFTGGVATWAPGLSNPMDDVGQMIYGGVAGAPTKLAANATTTNKFLRSVASGNPSWETLVAADIPAIAITQVTGLSAALSNKLATTLASGKIFVGNGSGAASPVLMSGDATLSNTGALTIANSAVTFAKIQNATVQYALIGRWSAGSGVFQEVTIDGVTITIDAFGVMSSTGGGGISSLNGLTASSQTFAAIGTSGTAPAWTSSGSAHTLDIPLASASSVTAGLISKTEYDTFNGKQSALSGTGYSKWSGSTPSYLTATQVTADLNVFTTSLQGLVPASGGGTTNFLRADGTWAVPAGGGSGVTTVGTFSGSSQTNGASISSTTITFGPADATNPGMVTTGTQTLAGAKTFSGAMTINPTASLTTAQLTFGSLTNNWISFSTVGNAVPALTTRSVGTKIVLYASLSGSALDYAIGTGVSTMWLSLGSSGDIFHIYAPISSVVTSVFSINPTTSIAYNGSAMTYGTNTTSTNVTGSAAAGIFSRNFINLGTGGGIAGPVTVGTSFSSRSLGTRLIIQSASNPSDADMAIGFNTNTFWQSVITSSYSFAWYAGAGSTGGTAATHLMNLSGTGVLNLVQSAGRLQIAGTQVVGPRDTGWTAMTGTSDKSTVYDTTTVTLAQLAGRVMAIQAAITTHGLIGA